MTLDKIYHAAYTLKDVARKTDLFRAPAMFPDNEVFLKTENLQVTGSFKLRGAYYKISQLSDEQKQKGVIACSAGNHAQGVALPSFAVLVYKNEDNSLQGNILFAKIKNLLTYPCVE